MIDVKDNLGREKLGTAARLWGNFRESVSSATARGPHLPAGRRETASCRLSGGGSGSSGVFLQPSG